MFGYLLDARKLHEGRIRLGQCCLLRLFIQPKLEIGEKLSRSELVRIRLDVSLHLGHHLILQLLSLRLHSL